MRLTAIGLGMLFVIGLASVGVTADGPATQTIELWPGKPPGENGEIGPEVAKTSKDCKNDECGHLADERPRKPRRSRSIGPTRARQEYGRRDRGLPRRGIQQPRVGP